MKELTNFIFELGSLRAYKEQGLQLMGISNGNSIADHSLRAAQIAFILAKMEGYENPFEPCTMNVFHEMTETRIGDLHKLAQRYITTDHEMIVKEQTENLGETGKDLLALFENSEFEKTTAGIIAKDADRLEHAFNAKEHVERGILAAQDWIDNARKILKTDSAKKLLEELDKGDSNEWWQKIKKI